MELPCHSDQEISTVLERITNHFYYSGSSYVHPIHTKNIWRRKIPKLCRPKKDLEFVSILRYFFPDFNQEDWEKKFSLFDIIKGQRDQIGLEIKQYLCICGQRIYDVCLIENTTTREIYQVGNCCVKKIMKEHYREMIRNFEQRQYEDEIKSSNIRSNFKIVLRELLRKPCITCNKREIETGDWKTQCTSCFKINKKREHESAKDERHLCSVCNKSFIRKTTETFKDKCIDCYLSKNVRKNVLTKIPGFYLDFLLIKNSIKKYKKK